MIEFEFKGSKATFDEGTGKLNCENPKAPVQQLIAKVNKLRRDKNKEPKTKLNIGSGFRPFFGYVNLDYDKDTYPDVIRDIEEGLPFDDNKFEEVYSSHVIEHIKDVFFYMAEIWRVTKKNGKVKIIAPYCGFLDWAIQPDHLRLINWGFFERWRPEHNSVQNELKQIRGAQFNILKTELINEAREIVFDLEVVK